MGKVSQHGFTVGEVLLVTSLFTFVTTGVVSFVSNNKNESRSTNEEIYRSMVLEGRETVDQIAAELRLAGYPGKSSLVHAPEITSANSNRVAAATFLVATGAQIIFEADVDHNGSVERVEYRLRGDNLERSAVTKNADGSVPAAEYETIAERVDNGGLPVFTYDGDLLGELPVPGDPQSVRVLLLLRSPVRDRKAGRNRTVGFEAIAKRHGSPMATEASMEEPAEANSASENTAEHTPQTGSQATAEITGVPSSEIPTINPQDFQDAAENDPARQPVEAELQAAALLP